jgi:osmotically-inducible protein OsmY
MRVTWAYQRSAADRAIRELTGVKGMSNAIRIKVAPQVSPKEIQQKIQAAFERSADIDARSVSVRADGGTVTLRGTVRSWAEHDQAAQAAWSALGVTDVVNQLNVETAPAYA